VKEPLPDIESALAPHGFHAVKEGGNRCICNAILKRQTINTNRAVAFVRLDTLPDDLSGLLKTVRKEVAFRCGFFPVLYGIGTQLILIVSGSVPAKVELDRYVDRIDNQWSIIQSIFLIHQDSGLIATARTWAQFVTGQYQDMITSVLKRSCADPARPISGDQRV